MGDRPRARQFIKNVDGFITLSRSVLDDISEFDKLKPKVFSPHPVYDHYGEIIPKEKAIQELGLDPSTNYILFFGFIRDYKGLDLLLEALADERLKNFNLKLMIAGEYYSGEEKYKALIKELHLEDRVISKNEFISDSKVAAHFCASDVVVQPYRTATQSGVTQIAYYFNKPMIVTNVGGLAELVPDAKAGYVVEPSAHAIADALVRFYSEKKENDFSLAAAEEKKKFEWRSFSGKLVELFRKL